jgi:hypothetical protein
MKDKFYQVFHGNSSVGFFRDREKAEKYANQFMHNIEGHYYNVSIKELDFLDNMLDEDLDDDNFDCRTWKE